VSKFFSPSSPFLAAKPELAIPDYLNGVAPMDPMRYALPREAEIGTLVRGAHSTSSSFAITLPELVHKLETARGGKQGVREKVQEVVARRCRKEPDSAGQEWLVWKH
jgi:3-hydroxyisobutyryl-CoA hydrolase